MNNKYFYTINKSVTNIYDLNPLRIVGFVSVFSDEAKKTKLTDISFQELELDIAFSDCPKTSKEAFNKYIEDLVMTKIDSEEVQAKLKQVNELLNLGLLEITGLTK